MENQQLQNNNHTKDYQNNCLICHHELIYGTASQEMTCVYCGQKHLSQVCCSQGHYICDQCHAASAYEVIKNYCLLSESTNPLVMANMIMKHPAVKMHGPEHHFLVPAVLLAAYCQATNNHALLVSYLEEAEKRAKNILGGFCGFYGACGAAVGTGIFFSVITACTPLAEQNWGLSNLITAESLKNIADFGGPRCCKRDVFTALKTAIVFLKEHLNIELADETDWKCDYWTLNQECLHQHCPYF